MIGTDTDDFFIRPDDSNTGAGSLETVSLPRMPIQCDIAFKVDDGLSYRDTLAVTHRLVAMNNDMYIVVMDLLRALFR